jgi:hypothetical protein
VRSTSRFERGRGLRPPRVPPKILLRPAGAAEPHLPSMNPLASSLWRRDEKSPSPRSAGERAGVRGLRAIAAIALVIAAGAISGCRAGLVKAHQRELLADRIMRLDGNPQERAADEHVLANREGAIGGTGTAGGGCGCN